MPWERVAQCLWGEREHYPCKTRTVNSEGNIFIFKSYLNSRFLFRLVAKGNNSKVNKVLEKDE